MVLSTLLIGYKRPRLRGLNLLVKERERERERDLGEARGLIIGRDDTIFILLLFYIYLRVCVCVCVLIYSLGMCLLGRKG